LALSAAANGAEIDERAFAILKKECLACHGGLMQMSKLDLRTRAAALSGGERGASIVPHQPEQSRLYQFATHQQNPAMPPGKKLPEADLEVLRKWILAGAGYPAPAASAAETGAKPDLAALEERPVTDEERRFWAFQKPVRPEVPGKGNPVDAFLAAGWAKKNLKPSPPASRRHLIRRAYLDVLGLPPPPEQVEAFVNDKNPNAWPRLVERLLASPHYGERWARHWLDLVRYADSGGFEYDRDRDNAWRYRDWVVRALNEDMPYDQFVRLQLAGDEYLPGDRDALIASGFLRLGPENNLKNEMTRMDELDDIISTVSLSLLGMTAGCARCHNHKFDPIPQKDYYRMQAVFFSTKPLDHPLVDSAAVATHKAAMKEFEARIEPLRKRKAEVEKPVKNRLFGEKMRRFPYLKEALDTPPEKRTEGQKLNVRQLERTNIDEKDLVAAMTEAEREAHAAVKYEIEAMEKQRPAPLPAAMAITESGREARPSYFLHRGDVSNKGSLMKPGALTVASWDEFPAPEPPADSPTSYRRRAFAEWVTSPENPLPARVMVNRIWQHHFGRGIVATASNFGKTGERPSHPELLDWLAAEFIRAGWSMKAMHRLMLHSQAYQMASNDIAANAAIDPENRLLWRMPRRRMEAEIVRDAVLAVAGTLDRTIGGPAVLPYIDPSLFQGSSKRTWEGKPDTDPSTWRRSLYVFNKRSIRYPLFESFDQPDMISSCARRNSSTTASQALLLMNNAMVRFQAEKFAERLRNEADSPPVAQVRRAFALALNRAPSAAELARAMALIRASGGSLVDFCQALFNLNEFVYLP
jgi:hypothetical protein